MEQYCGKGMTPEIKFGQILELQTPAQGYLMYKTFVSFNDRGFRFLLSYFERYLIEGRSHCLRESLDIGLLTDEGVWDLWRRRKSLCRTIGVSNDQLDYLLKPFGEFD